LLKLAPFLSAFLALTLNQKVAFSLLLFSASPHLSVKAFDYGFLGALVAKKDFKKRTNYNLPVPDI